MNRRGIINTRFSTEKTTDSEYHIVDRWEEAFARWFEGNCREHCWSRVAVLTDEYVWALYGDTINSVLSSLHRSAVPLVLPPGEDSKDFGVLPRLVETLLHHRVHRRDLLLCAGGGVCCDVGGLLALLYMRGMDYVNVPTSLMAQIDAAVGGKVGSNFGINKNLLGGFHQPLQVFIDASFLDTLPDIHFRSALAEAVKIAIIRQDESLMELLEGQSKELLNRHPRLILKLLKSCLVGKLELLADDPYEICLDRSLNLGHAAAHALERLPDVSGSRKLLHGEAVAVGIATAIRYAFKSGLCSREWAIRLLAILKGLGLPSRVDPADLNQVKSQLARVSDQRGGLLRLVVPQDKGGVTILSNVELDRLLECLEPIPGLGM
jgi:3-dehydroquinate synthetase